MRDEWVDVVVDEVLKETDEAVLLLIDGDEVWVPLSRVDGVPPEVGAVNVTVSVKKWFAEKENLGDY